MTAPSLLQDAALFAAAAVFISVVGVLVGRWIGRPADDHFDVLPTDDEPYRAEADEAIAVTWPTYTVPARYVVPNPYPPYTRGGAS